MCPKTRLERHPGLVVMCPHVDACLRHHHGCRLVSDGMGFKVSHTVKLWVSYRRNTSGWLCGLISVCASLPFICLFCLVSQPQDIWAQPRGAEFTRMCCIRGMSFLLKVLQQRKGKKGYQGHMSFCGEAKKKKEVKMRSSCSGKNSSLFLDDWHQKQAANVFNIWKKKLVQMQNKLERLEKIKRNPV